MCDIEMIRDPITMAMHEGVLCHPGLNELMPNGDWISAVNRATGLDLFIYHHLFQGTFCVAGWVLEPVEPNGKNGVLIELCNMVLPPDWNSPDRPSIPWMQWRTRPVVEQAQEQMDKIKGRQKERARREADDIAAQYDMAKHLRHKGEANEASSLETGHTPFESREHLGAEIWDETQDRLTEIAKSQSP